MIGIADCRGLYAVDAINVRSKIKTLRSRSEFNMVISSTKER